MKPHIYMMVLARCTNLVHLEIEFSGIGTPNSPVPNTYHTALILPHLKKLMITRASGTDSDAVHELNIISGLTAPNLVSLRIHRGEDSWDTPKTPELIEALQAFQNRSTVSLSRLELSDSKYRHDVESNMNRMSLSGHALWVSEENPSSEGELYTVSKIILSTIDYQRALRRDIHYIIHYITLHQTQTHRERHHRCPDQTPMPSASPHLSVT